MNDWIEWKGGECPVADDVVIEARMRSSTAGFGDPCPARYWDWSHGNCPEQDIIAYRVIAPEKPAAQPAKPATTWKAGEWYPLRGGGRAFIYCTDAPGARPIHGRIDGHNEPDSWPASGAFLGDHAGLFVHDYDLLPPRAELVAYLHRDNGSGTVFLAGCAVLDGATCLGSRIVREGEHHDR